MNLNLCFLSFQRNPLYSKFAKQSIHILRTQSLAYETNRLHGCIQGIDDVIHAVCE